jgi:hypothetical protein
MWNEDQQQRILGRIGFIERGRQKNERKGGRRRLLYGARSWDDPSLTTSRRLEVMDTHGQVFAELRRKDNLRVKKLYCKVWKLGARLLITSESH